MLKQDLILWARLEEGRPLFLDLVPHVIDVGSNKEPNLWSKLLQTYRTRIVRLPFAVVDFRNICVAVQFALLESYI